MARTVDVLLLEGCPNAPLAIARAREAIARSGARADVRVVQVVSDDEARRLRFLGSPTVRVDGVDVEPSAAQRDDFGCQCRVYAVEGRLQGAPPLEWIVATLASVPRDR